MKLIIELTKKQVEKLKEENTTDLPMTSFLKSTFKFKSVERVIKKKKATHTAETLQHILHRMNNTKR